MTKIPIGQGYYVSPSAPLSSLTCNNLYPQYPLTKNPLSEAGLLRTPGAEAIQDSGVIGVGRGTRKFQKSDWLFHVTGDKLVKRTAINSVSTVVGTISGSGQVSMADNGETLCIIVPGVTGYFYDIDTDVLTEITDPVFTDFGLQEGGVTSVTEHNNRFVYTTDEEFFIGSLVTTNKGTDFNALDFEDAESANDPIVRAMETSNELYIFNTETIEVYKDIGGTDFPYQRIPGATIDRGLASRFAVVHVKSDFYFLGKGENEQPSIIKTTPGGSQRVSTAAIDTLIQSYTDYELSTVVAWTYSADGADFLGFNLPNQTVVLDLVATTLAGVPIWHTRTTGGSKWRVNTCQSIFGTTIVDDSLDSRVGSIERSITSEYGAAVDREFTTLYLNAEGRSFVTRKVELTCTRGVGTPLSNPVPENYNPTIECFFSVDQGNTYQTLGTTTFGNTGDYLQRQLWRRLGRSSTALILKFTTSAKVALDIQRLDLEIGV